MLGGAFKPLLLALRLAGTFVFALSGALAGARRQFDFFGIPAIERLQRAVVVFDGAEIYALAALAGAAVVVIGNLLLFPSPLVAAAGAVLCFGIQVLAILRCWQLPGPP